MKEELKNNRRTIIGAVVVLIGGFLELEPGAMDMLVEALSKIDSGVTGIIALVGAYLAGGGMEKAKQEKQKKQENEQVANKDETIL